MSAWTIDRIDADLWIATRTSDGLYETFPTRDAAQRYIIRRTRDAAGLWDIGHRTEAIEQQISNTGHTTPSAPDTPRPPKEDQ